MPAAIVDTELLMPPAVGTARAYVPELLFDIEPDDPGAGRAAGFYLTVASTAPEQIELRLMDLEAGTASSLMEVKPAGTIARSEVGLGPDSLNATTLSLLRCGSGVYWFADEDAATKTTALGDRQHRLAVVIPESTLSAFMRLAVSTTTAEEGTPVEMDAIELVHDFFYLAVVGDSVLWGTGLTEPDKIYTQVSRVIEAETRRKVIPQVKAVGAAPIVPTLDDGPCEQGCGGEVPTSRTSLPLQADLLERPDLLDLILLNGCAIDVGDNVSLAVYSTSDEELAALVHTYCEVEMVNLLHKIRALAPQAKIVVLGYYQALSESPDTPAENAWLRALGLPPGDIPFVDGDEAVAASGLFEQLTRENLTAAVDAVNREQIGDPMAAFAAPVFRPENTVFGRDPWLWGLTTAGIRVGPFFIALTVLPEDPMFSLRRTACFDPNLVTDRVTCLFGSFGHPNPAGARAYADAAAEVLRDLGVLSP